MIFIHFFLLFTSKLIYLLCMAEKKSMRTEKKHILSKLEFLCIIVLQLIFFCWLTNSFSFIQYYVSTTYNVWTFFSLDYNNYAINRSYWEKPNYSTYHYQFPTDSIPTINKSYHPTSFETIPNLNHFYRRHHSMFRYFNIKYIFSFRWINFDLSAIYI